MLKYMQEVPAATYDVIIAQADRTQQAEHLHPGMIAKGYAEVGRTADGRMLGCLMDTGQCYVDKAMLVGYT